MTGSLFLGAVFEGVHDRPPRKNVQQRGTGERQQAIQVGQPAHADGTQRGDVQPVKHLVEIEHREAAIAPQAQEAVHPAQIFVALVGEALQRHCVGVALVSNDRDAVRVGEAGVQQVEQIVVCDDAALQEVRDRRQPGLEVLAARVLGVIAPVLPDRVLVSADDDLPLRRRKTKLRGADGIVAGRAVALQGAHEVGPVHAEMAQVRLAQIAPQIEGQHDRVDCLTQVVVIRLGIQELRVGEQLRGRGGGCLGDCAVQHARFEDFIHEVHIGQHGVGVFARKLDVLEVRTRAFAVRTSKAVCPSSSWPSSQASRSTKYAAGL